MAETNHITGMKPGEDILLDMTIIGTGSIGDWTLASYLRDPKSNIVVVTRTSDDGISITDPDERTVSISIPAALTQDIPARQYLFDVWREDTGHHYCLSDGTLTLERSAKNG